MLTKMQRHDRTGCLCTCEQHMPNGSTAAGRLTGSNVLRVGENFTNRNTSRAGFGLILIFINRKVAKLIKNVTTLKTFSPLKGQRSIYPDLLLLMAATVIVNNILLICQALCQLSQLYFKTPKMIKTTVTFFISSKLINECAFSVKQIWSEAYY